MRQFRTVMFEDVSTNRPLYHQFLISRFSKVTALRLEMYGPEMLFPSKDGPLMPSRMKSFTTEKLPGERGDCPRAVPGWNVTVSPGYPETVIGLPEMPLRPLKFTTSE